MYTAWDIRAFAEDVWAEGDEALRGLILERRRANYEATNAGAAMSIPAAARSDPMIAVVPSLAKVYVVHTINDGLYLGALSGNLTTRTFATTPILFQEAGWAPTGVVADDELKPVFFVTGLSFGGGPIGVIDAATDRALPDLAQLDLTRYALYINQTTDTLFVVISFPREMTTASLNSVDARTGQPGWTAVFPSNVGPFAVNETTDEIYASLDENGPKLHVIRGGDGAITRRLATGSRLGAMVAGPSASAIYGLTGSSNQLAELVKYDLDQQQIVGRTTLPGGSMHEGLLYNPQTSELIVADTVNNRLHFYRELAAPPPTRSLSGRAVDPNGEPIGGVEVRLSPTEEVATTDAQGRYSFTAVGPGELELTGSHPGFNFRSPVRVGAGAQAAVPDLLGTRRPLIFVPGIMGSYLDQHDGTRICNLWPGLPRDDCRIPPAKNPAMALPTPAGGPTIYATYAIEAFGEIYGSLLSRLEQRRSLGGGGYRGARPTETTPLQRCSSPLADQTTTLFVFAYDWRQDLAQSAQQLAQLVDCVRRLHGGEVDVLTHSMGGLVARRYVVERKEESHVNKLITIAAPWLGAPRVLPILSTGWYEDSIHVLISRRDLKAVAPTMPGVWQLAPSPYYFDLVAADERPLVERGRDLDGDLWPWENRDNLDYAPTMIWLEDEVQKPGYGFRYNLNLHTAAQDDFRHTSYGIRYFHIYGVGAREDTLQSLVAMSRTGCLRTETLIGTTRCESVPGFEPRYTSGDGTVPQVSAARQSPRGDLNAPGATVLQLLGGVPANGDVTHTALAANESAIIAVLAELSRSGAAPAVAASPQAEHDPEPAFYLNMYGTGAITIADEIGNTTDTLSGTLTSPVPGLVYTPLGEQQHTAVLPATGSYTVTFRAGASPLQAEVTRGTDSSADLAVRHLDVNVPANSVVQLRLTGQGAVSLRFDGNGDGLFEGTVAPTATIAGPAADDRAAPVLEVGRTGPFNRSRVTLTATDEGAGVRQVLYSLDGTTFRVYSGPLEVNALATPTLYAFADDAHGNRSSLLVSTLVQRVHLPSIRR